jgi:hypothetical protein
MMASEPPNRDPRNLWQSQPVEPLHMTAERIRGNAQRHYQQSLLQARLSIALGVVLCLVFAWAAATAPQMFARIGWAILSLWSAYFGYHAQRWLQPEQLAPDAPFGPSLAFYRRELEKRSDYNRHGWRRAGLIFCFLGLGLVILPPLIRSPRVTPNAAPFFVLLLGWLVAYFRIRASARRKLEMEIEELRAFEREAQ